MNRGVSPTVPPPPVISSDRNPRKRHFTALQLDFPPMVPPHPVISSDRNPRKRHFTALQLDFPPMVPPHHIIPSDRNPRKHHFVASVMDLFAGWQRRIVIGSYMLDGTEGVAEYYKTLRRACPMEPLLCHMSRLTVGVSWRVLGGGS